MVERPHAGLGPVPRASGALRAGRLVIGLPGLILAFLALGIQPGQGAAGAAGPRQGLEQADPGPATILADGQFVYGPNVGGFSTADYLKATAPTLYPLAGVVENHASYYSMNPRVILALWELLSGAITADPPLPPDQFNSFVGNPDGRGYQEDMVMLCEAMVSAYYGRLGNEPPANAPPLEFVLRDGIKVRVAAETNAASLAILSSLAPLMTERQWQALVSPADPDGFTGTYARLFPADDPLDTANRVVPGEAPPPSLLKLPYECNDTWYFTGGPHGWGGCDSYPYSSVDFAPAEPSCTVPLDRWIVSPAAGSVTRVSCGECLVRISHGDGWESGFYHVANAQVATGDQVTADQRIGNPSQRPTCTGNCDGCGGSATGVHVHYAVLYNGAYVSIAGTALEGWVVHATTCYNGYLDRDGERREIGSRVSSTECDNCCGCASGPERPAGAWADAVARLSARAQPEKDLLVRAPEPASDRAVLLAGPGPALPLDLPASDSYLLIQSVFGNGAGPEPSTGYVMDGTGGQPTDLRYRQSASYVLVPGFWGQPLPELPRRFDYLPLLLRDR